MREINSLWRKVVSIVRCYIW